MGFSITLSPAYGRDYKSKKEVQKDWDEDKDFVIEDVNHPDCGRYANKKDLTGKYQFINIRFKKMQNVHVVK